MPRYSKTTALVSSIDKHEEDTNGNKNTNEEILDHSSPSVVTPPPPPLPILGGAVPPPPPPMSILTLPTPPSSGEDKLRSRCAEVYRCPLLPEQPPLLVVPPPRLDLVVHRVGVIEGTKMFMKKKL